MLNMYILQYNHGGSLVHQTQYEMGRHCRMSSGLCTIHLDKLAQIPLKVCLSLQQSKRRKEHLTEQKCLILHYSYISTTQAIIMCTFNDKMESIGYHWAFLGQHGISR